MLRILAPLTRTLSLPLAALALSTSSALAQTQPIDLSTWQPVQYEINVQNDANWQLQPGSTSVIQTVNADPCIFLSDFDAAGQEIRGTWRADGHGDDDFMGFVFGYQGRGQFYLFDWKQNSQGLGGAFAEQGMSLKIVQAPAGQDPTLEDLWNTAGTANVTVPLHNTIQWFEFIDYEFVLSFTPGSIEITVLEDDVELEHWMLADSTYSSGNFGFYNSSQAPVVYESFTQVSVATVYCTAKENSQGCTPTLTTTGAASLSDTTPFLITAESLINNRRGMLFYGLSGRNDIPFGGGVLCVKPPLMRSPIMSTRGNPGASDCSGSMSFDVNAWLQGAGGPAVVAGDQMNVQFFYRDPAHPDGTGYGLTEGVEFVVLP